jgi:hypothetical protein
MRLDSGVAQSAEPGPHKVVVAGSIPAPATKTRDALPISPAMQELMDDIQAQNLKRAITPLYGHSPKPNMQTLRDICAGKLPTEQEISAEERRRASYPLALAEAIAEIPICGFKWWEDGEQYECLMDRGHKIPKHGQRGMVQRVES